MLAKSITALLQDVRARFMTREFQNRLSYAPVALVMAVAVLPFTLGVEQEQAVEENAAIEAAAPADAIMKTSVAAKPPHRAGLPDERRYKVIAEFMARKYRVSQDVVQDLVKTAHAVGRQLGVDPLLLVAVMAVESSFNPIAESVAGAKGLMQIIPKYHTDKFAEFGGEQAALDPRVNILVGARIIREYLSASSGDLFAALQTYAGALTDRDAIYTHRVLNEKDKLDELSGLPKTDRGARVARLDAAAPQAGGRVTVTVPAAPAASEIPATKPVPAAVAPAPAVPTATTPTPAVVPPVEKSSNEPTA